MLGIKGMLPTGTSEMIHAHKRDGVAGLSGCICICLSCSKRPSIWIAETVDNRGMEEDAPVLQQIGYVLQVEPSLISVFCLCVNPPLSSSLMALASLAPGMGGWRVWPSDQRWSETQSPLQPPCSMPPLGVSLAISLGPCLPLLPPKSWLFTCLSNQSRPLKIKWNWVTLLVKPSWWLPISFILTYQFCTVCPHSCHLSSPSPVLLGLCSRGHWPPLNLLLFHLWASIALAVPSAWNIFH